MWLDKNTQLRTFYFMMQDNYYNYCNNWETTIIATTERLSHTIDKRHFTKGRNAEVLYRCHFLFVSSFLLFSCCFYEAISKKVKETNFFEKKYSGWSCL